ncbi:N-acetyltransferase 9-like protein [Ornithodoros turicata]|uniref:N-acetyltransferase 9-like protein n=1 Tax=Ornithodoros turicata TaxID=34597 RepID=UPI003138A549
MRTNQNTEIWSGGIIFVPYKEHHVLKYHEWMKTPFLQEMTASEPLSLEEEYQMQKSWLEDDDKCTFIILEKEAFTTTSSETESMIGDVNLFFNNQDDPHEAEIEVMIAEPAYRKKGLGKQAICTMMRYGAQTLHIKTFTAKIKLQNKDSIALFEKLGFILDSTSEIFQEATYILKVDEHFEDRLKAQTNSYVIKQRTS